MSLAVHYFGEFFKYCLSFMKRRGTEPIGIYALTAISLIVDLFAALGASKTTPFCSKGPHHHATVSLTHFACETALE